MDLRLGFLASGDGSNVEAILRNIELGTLCAQPKIIITNNPTAGVIEVAHKYRVPSVCLNEKQYFHHPSLEDAIISNLQSYGVNFVVLAGYMKLLGKKVLDAYDNRVSNIHPSLLPKYKGKGMHGLNVHQAVINARDTESGATVHLVDPILDNGRILSQARVSVFPTDSPKSLSDRVLDAEHILYSKVLREIQMDIIKL